MKSSICIAVVLLVALGTAAASDPAPTFHGIKLGVSLGSQFQECPWDPPAKHDIPAQIYSPYKDQHGATVPCFHDWAPFTPAAYPQVESSVVLIDRVHFLKDTEGKVRLPEPMFGAPTINIKVLVPASSQLRDGTIEEVRLDYTSWDANRVRSALVEKFGVSHPPEKKVDPKILEFFGTKKLSIELWDTSWGELTFSVTDRGVMVVADTSAFMRFEQQNKKDEF